MPDSHSKLESLVNRLEIAVNKMENSSSKSMQIGSSSTPIESDVNLDEFNSIMNGPLVKYVNLSKKIGDCVSIQADDVLEAFKAQKKFLIDAIGGFVAKPEGPKAYEPLGLMLKPTSDLMSKIGNDRELNRRSIFFNHMSAISESIAALAWVNVSPAPAPYVRDMIEASKFYTNRVLKDAKDGKFNHPSSTHNEWISAWVDVLSQLYDFVKARHTTGLVWGSYKGKVGSAPPPPLPPPMPKLTDLFINESSKANKNDNDSRDALFDEINKGSDVTKGLKKVTADMQTHKNAALRSGPSHSEQHLKTTSSSLMKGDKAKPSRLELEGGKKWIVEHFHDQTTTPIEINCEFNQPIYIYKCSNSTFKVNGAKCYNIVMDECVKCGVVFQSALSSVEFVNCKSVRMQVLGSVPTICIDKTDGCQVYLSADYANTHLITAKSSEMNVLIPNADDIGEFVEQPVPEQFKTTFGGGSGKLKTVPLDSI